MSCALIGRQSGFGLVETLIALLVFSVAVLGLSSMQLAGKRGNYEAIQRSIATSLARDILERARSNFAALPAYAVDELGAASTSAPRDCRASVCTGAELARHDLHEWAELLAGASEQVTVNGGNANAGGLVDFRACIRSDSGRFSVAISWRGMIAMANPRKSTCGEASGLYGPDNENRRLLLIQTYIGGLSR